MQPQRQHTDQGYEEELRRLREQLLLMGAKVEEMLANSMRALVERDSLLAREMIEFDHQINRLELECDEACLKILARRQPVASDLRFITIALKLVTDLERMGDLAVNICERVVELNDEPPLKPYLDLPRMRRSRKRCFAMRSTRSSRRTPIARRKSSPTIARSTRTTPTSSACSSRT